MAWTVNGWTTTTSVCGDACLDPHGLVRRRRRLPTCSSNSNNRTTIHWSMVAAVRKTKAWPLYGDRSDMDPPVPRNDEVLLPERLDDDSKWWQVHPNDGGA